VEHVPTEAFPKKPHRILILGMGGSAILGDIVRTYTTFTPGADHLDIRVHRGYHFPPSLVDRRTLVIASSYSGNTEETLTAFELARLHTPHIACLTSGGYLLQRSHELGLPLIPLPSGFPPRGALGFSFFALLLLFLRLNYFRKTALRLTEKAIAVTHNRLKELAELYSKPDEEDNPTTQLAHQLRACVPIIYATERMEAVGLRWRQQIQENAKHAAFGNVVPEMNHNEINGWRFPEGFPSENVHLIWMQDPEDHPRIRLRIEHAYKLLAPFIPLESNTFLRPEEPQFLTRLFALIYFGDWVSYWLALLHRIEPIGVPIIEDLKKHLSTYPYDPNPPVTVKQRPY
ncbi:MAG: bifunctional phosphoglucose/phosphomannose isomerase, partial [Candidatus Kapabacteria bacterium]|nr:bifunctional phosphoglucose/phosphomannose isomerase [Candidatus Kapabacteria bacterium]